VLCLSLAKNKNSQTLNGLKASAAAIDTAAGAFSAKVESSRAEARGPDGSQRCFFSAASTIALTARQSSTPAIVPSLP
jgi:hypothetical protein